MDKNFPTDDPVRSRTMSRIRSEDTGPEMALRRPVWRLGLRYRTHVRALPGTPDMAFPSARVAVFVDGDFWHGRLLREAGKCPAHNGAAWRAKLERNAARDARVDGKLRALGWLPVRFWASDVLRDADACARLVSGTVTARRPPKKAGPRHGR